MGDAIRSNGIFVQGDLGLLKVPEKPKLALEEEQKALPGLPGTRCATDPVDVVARIVRGIVLDDPIDVRDIETARSYVCAQEDARLGIYELEEGGRALLLLLLALSRQ